MEKLAWRFGSRASQQSHMRLQLCKHCAASAPTKTKALHSWLRVGWRRIRQREFGKHRLEPRVVTQRIETAIPEPCHECAVALGRVNFQLIQGAAAFSQRYEIECVPNRIPANFGIVRRSFEAIYSCDALRRVGHAASEQPFSVFILAVEFSRRT